MRLDSAELKSVEGHAPEGQLFLECILDSLFGEVAVLNTDGVIVAVNDAWERFALENGLEPIRASQGVNYLDACRRALSTGEQAASRALEAIVRVLKGSSELELVEYDCDSPSVRRAFAMRVTPFKGRNGGAVVVHSNITQLKDAQEALRKALAELEAAKNKTEEENVYLREREELRLRDERVICHSRAMREVLRLVEQVAVTDSTVLLLGETGTGKELLASSVHHSSSRRGGTLVSLNCAAMPAALVESELFGREKGAFTGSLARQVGRFELASGSTIFLDEVGELSPEVQGKLLRVLETRQIERLGNPKPIAVDVRVIAATNRDLERAVHEGKFRSDLYYRLNVFPIRVPSLRERPEDISSLVWAFVDEFSKRFNKNIQSIEKESLDALRVYTWPGNVRELRNLIERAMILANGPKLRVQLPPTGMLHQPATARKLEEIERQHILEILEKTGWRVRGSIGAAQQLGLKPTTLEARMAKLGIRRPSR